MEMAFWSVLMMAFILGLLAAWISQFTAARKGLDANAKAKALRQSVEDLYERNGTRRYNLRRRQETLDKYLMMDIEHSKGQLDDVALKSAIKEERQRIANLKQTIKESEDVIIANRRTLAEIEKKRSLNSGWLLFTSGAVGGVTALIFAFIGYLEPLSGIISSSTKETISFATVVGLNTSLIVQSLALGAGWPLVWEKVFAIDRLESTASSAATIFQEKIKEIEKEEV